MLILDNSVLSAFTRLNLLPKLKQLIPKVAISTEIFQEYSIEWRHIAIPSWIEIKDIKENFFLVNAPSSLSDADLSIIKLAREYQYVIASDDRTLRNYAKSLDIKITGSLGLLKKMFQKGIIGNREKYMQLLESLQEDVYFSEELM